jgi:hypothetical protein
LIQVFQVLLKKYFFKLKTFDLTGVYICKLENPTIDIDPLNDEKFAHLDVNNPKVLKYIGSDENHKFMKKIAVS